MKYSVIKQFSALIKKGEKILLVVPEGSSIDAWAGMLASKLILEKMGKEVLAVSTCPMPKKLSFLGMKGAVVREILQDGDFIISIDTNNSKVDRVKYTMEDTSVDILVTPKKGQFSSDDVSFRQSVGDFDCIIGFDVPNAENLGAVFEDNTELFAKVPVINVSTNPAFDTFGQIQLVFPEKSSICEVVHDAFWASGAKEFGEPIASVLLTGIISATNSFMDQKTTSSGFELAAQLQEEGAKQSDIIEHLFKHKSLVTLKLWGGILQHLKMDVNHQMAWSVVQKSEVEAIGGSGFDIETITQDLLRFLNGVDVVSLMIESEEGVKVELRSSMPAFDFSPFVELTDRYIWREMGIDLFFKTEDLPALEKRVLQVMAQIQVARLRLDPERPIEKFEIKIRAPEEQKDTFTQVIQEVKQQLSPEAPSDIPFELSNRKAKEPILDSDFGIGKTIADSVAKEKIAPSPVDKNKPSWFKTG